MKKITPFLWFDTQAEEAVNFYTSLFDESSTGKITRYIEEGKEVHGMDAGTIMTIDFDLAGQKFAALNGGHHFKMNPGISFFVTCDTEEEVGRLWNRLIEGGQAMMPLDTYDWSEKYGWLQDRFGVTWQISLGKIEEVGQKITPTFLFVNEVFGKAEEALNHYTSIFKNSHVDGILKYGPDEQGPEGMVKHAQFALEGEKFMIMDGPGQHEFHFNEAISFVVNCNSTNEVDYYWEKLNEGGDPKAQQCGWLKDKFGVSWQVVPTALTEMLADKDSEKVKRVTSVMLNMKKLGLGKLQEAYSN